MGVTAIVGAAAGIGGLLIGGGSVATYNYVRKKRQQEELNNYYNYLRDLRLKNKNIRIRMTSNPYN